MNISVLGCGRWASTIAWYLNKINHNVLMWGREGSSHLKELIETRKNDYLQLSEDIELTSSLGEAFKHSDYIVISITEQNLRNLMTEIIKQQFHNKIFILCMKGIEQSTGLRLSEVVKEFVGDLAKVAIWVGPGHPQEFIKSVPTCMVIDSEEQSIKEKLIKEFRSDLIRFYYGNDIIGNEVGAAAKNIIGIAGGILDGLNMTSLKGALMARGTKEVADLIEVMGGNRITAYGLSCLGDYEATVFSPHSNSRKFGEMLVKGQEFTKHTPGIYTTKSIKELSEKYGVQLPICNAVYSILYDNQEPKTVLKNLFKMDIVKEF